MESERSGTRSLVAFFVLTFGFSWTIYYQRPFVGLLVSITLLSVAMT